MERKNLIPIGKLAEITGVHVQSLRYYEKIGILLPSYVDADSKYRYYSFSQIKLVEAIQYCVELDIPLKQFTAFILKEKNQIDYEKIIAYGKEIAAQKIRAIEKKMCFLEDLNEKMLHSERCREDEFIVSFLPERLYLTCPYKGTQADKGFYAVIIKLLQQLRAQSLQTGYEIGLLSRFGENKQEHFAYVNVLQDENVPAEHPQMLRIPAGKFLCKRKDRSNIEDAPQIYKEQFAQPYEKTVIELELFTGKFRYSEPVYEIQCSLPAPRQG